MQAVTPIDEHRAGAALAAWYAPGRIPTLEPGDVADMLAALDEPTAEASLIRWAYKKPPVGDLPGEDLAAMERARAAAAQVTA